VLGVYTDLTINLLFYLGSFSIFELDYDLPDNGTRLPVLPSWVNDWTQKTTQNLFTDTRYNAGLYQKGQTPDINISFDRRLLMVKVQLSEKISRIIYPRGVC
jgi:hypothetical protein